MLDISFFTRQPEITADRLKRFEQKIMPVPFCGCVLWLASTNEHGYGVFWNGTRLEKAHRFALRASGEIVPDCLDVLHKCDVPACVNADHLFIGTAKDNTDDMWAKARATVQFRRGTSQSQAKLTDGKAEEIRQLYRAGAFNQYQLADIFDVSQSLIWRVIHRVNWFAESGVVIEQRRGK